MTAATLAIGGRFRPPFTTKEATVTRRKATQYYATEEGRAELEQLAALRFGGNLTGAIRWAVELAVLVASDPATHGRLDPAAALAGYVDAQCEGERP